MDRIRVIVANRPRLMRELVSATLADQPDIEVIAESADDSNTVRLVVESNPDFVILALGSGDRLPSVCDFLLARNPAIKIIALATERKYAVCLWSQTGIQSTEIENSEQGILNALRARQALPASLATEGGRGLGFALRVSHSTPGSERAELRVGPAHGEVAGGESRKGRKVI